MVANKCAKTDKISYSIHCFPNGSDRFATTIDHAKDIALIELRNNPSVRRCNISKLSHFCFKQTIYPPERKLR